MTLLSILNILYPSLRPYRMQSFQESVNWKPGCYHVVATPHPLSPSSLFSMSDKCVPGKIPVLSCRVQVCCLHGFPPTLDPLDYIQRHVAIQLEVTACTGLRSRTFPKLNWCGGCVVMDEAVTVCHTVSETFLCIPISTSVIIRKVAVKYGCLGTSGAHH